MNKIVKREWLKLFSNCIIVKGHTRAIICDLQNNIFYIIPSEICIFADMLAKRTIKSVVNLFPNKKRSIYQYIDFVISNGLGILISKNLFERTPNLSLEWETPEIITNAIFDFSNENNEHLGRFLSELSDCGCQNLQIRIFERINKRNLNGLINQLKRSRISNIQLIVNYKYSSKYTPYLINTINSIPNVMSLIVFNYSGNQIDQKLINSGKHLILSNELIISEKNCGFISPSFFDINIKMFVESIKYNSCLNRKISVDKHGDIKNCPSMEKKYGNIKNTSLKKVLQNDSFKILWKVNKNKILVCKDCEFRYICTDCRAYLQDPNNIYSKPLKCGYNPYTNKWEEWSTNPLSNKSIGHYGLQEFVK